MIRCMLWRYRWHFPHLCIDSVALGEGKITLRAGNDRTSLEELNAKFLKTIHRIMGDRICPIDITTKLLPLSGTEFERYLKERGKYRGDVFRFNYKIEDPSVRFIYYFLKVSGTIVSSLKKLFPRKDWDRKWLES